MINALLLFGDRLLKSLDPLGLQFIEEVVLVLASGLVLWLLDIVEEYRGPSRRWRGWTTCRWWWWWR